MMNAANNDALKLVFVRNAFYRKLYFLSFAAFTLSILCIIFLTCVVTALFRYPPAPLYFPADSLGRLIRDIPVSKLNMSNENLLQWVGQAIETAKSFDFINYRSELNEAQKYFSGFGWGRYMRALDYSNNLNAVTQRNVIFSAKLTGNPHIDQEGMLHGALAWKITVPFQVTAWLPPYSDSTKFYNNYQAYLVVQRQPILQSYQGLAIMQLIEERLDQYDTQLQEFTNTQSVQTQ